jgi:hypothetical protein
MNIDSFGRGNKFIRAVVALGGFGAASFAIVALGATQSAFPRTPLETPVPPVTGIPAFCRVIAVLTPTADSKIGIEVWLPISGWNGKLESIANHLQGGAYYYSDMDAALKRNYAVASTDTGHKDTEANWALGHPEKMTDFSWRAVHEMTLATTTAAPRAACKRSKKLRGSLTITMASSPAQDFIIRRTSLSQAPGKRRSC